LQLPPLPPRTKPYSLDEAAEELGYDRSHVYRLMKDGEFPNAYHGESLSRERSGNSPRPCDTQRQFWRIPAADVEAFKLRRRGQYN
jgi:hypothetical protein